MKVTRLYETDSDKTLIIHRHCNVSTVSEYTILKLI